MGNPLIIPVILSGGCGSRLWPMSRQDRPKQFLKLLDDTTLFQAAILRSLSVLDIEPSKIVTVTHTDLKEETIQQMMEIDAGLTDHILAEPCSRNTSAAVLYAALYVHKIFGGESLIWVLPSDHHIGDHDALARALKDAVTYVQDGEFVTFGIKPDRPETDFGYIAKGQKLENAYVFKCADFIEKPHAEKAVELLESGNYLWNSGMYLMRVNDIISTYNHLSPDTVTILHSALNTHANLKNPLNEFYTQIKKDPFETVILEKVGNVTIVETDPQWSDVGSWDGLWQASHKNNYGNVTEGRVICKDTTGSIIKSASGRLITCIGLKDLVITDTDDTIMIAGKHSAAQLKHLVGTLQKIGSPETMKPMASDDGEHEYTLHTICIPPERTYEILPDTDEDTVFIVAAGEADFTLHGECRTLNMRDTVTVPAHTLCSFTNSGLCDLKILEMRFGETADDHDEIFAKTKKTDVAA